jgi:hypothetical protein
LLGKSPQPISTMRRRWRSRSRIGSRRRRCLRTLIRFCDLTFLFSIPARPGAGVSRNQKATASGNAWIGLPTQGKAAREGLAILNPAACGAICFQAVCHLARLFCPGSIAYRLRIGVPGPVASPLLIACPFQIVVLSRFAYRRPTASHRCPSWSPWGCRESCWIARGLYHTKAARWGLALVKAPIDAG